MFQDIAAFFKGIGKVFDVITHPIKIWNWFVGVSYLICLVLIIAGVFLYIMGSAKGRKLIGWSLLGYFIIQSISSCF